MLPIKDKPKIDMRYQDSVKIYNDAISTEQAQELLSWAQSDDSGIHRNSSNQKTVNASFSTCLIYRHDNPIYAITGPLWERYINEHSASLSFIEPYELKIYEKNDKFDDHRDAFGSVHFDMDRKINLILQISEKNDYDGGLLYVGDFECPATFGTAIFFPAHYIHRVTEVTRGRRISLIGHAWGPIYR